MAWRASKSDLMGDGEVVRFIRLRLVVLLVALVMVSGQNQPAISMPINYVESTSGDLTFPLQTFALGAGLNTFSGSINRPAVSGTGDVGDFFLFSLGTNKELVSVTLQITSIGFGGPILAYEPLIEIFEGEFISEIGETTQINALTAMAPVASTLLFGPTFPGAGEYAAKIRAFSSGFAGSFASVDYVATLEVAAIIPLPAALPLFGTGLGILGFMGWRRRRRAEATF